MRIFIVALLSALSSSLAVPPQSATSQNLTVVVPQCYAPDPGTDDTWRNECQWLLDLFAGQRSIPSVLTFGAGGVPVPYLYRGPIHQTTVQCEIRIDLINDLASESIEKWRLWAAGELILGACVRDSGQGRRLGGRLTGIGRRDHLNIALGKIPVPRPPTGGTSAVQPPAVDVT